MRVRGTCLLAAVLFTLAGCLRCVHPICPPPPELTAPCQGLPDLCRDHVYVYLLHGLDPFDCANLFGVSDYIRYLGFCHVRYGQFYEAGCFRKDICRVRQEDPFARFVVIGFSRGARAAYDLADDLRADGVMLSLLVYLDGKGLMYLRDPRPENVERIVNVRAPGLVWQSPCIDGAANLDVPVWHFSTPTQPSVLDALAQELMMVAATPPAVSLMVLPAPAPAGNPPPVLPPPAGR